MARSLRSIVLVALAPFPSLSVPQEADRPALTARAPLRAKPARTVLDADQDGRALEVKFVHGADVRLEGGRLASADPEIRRLDAWLERLGTRRVRVFEQDPAHLDALRRSGELRSGRGLHDPNLFFRVECGAAMAARICDGLNRSAAVEIAYPLGRVADPVLTVAPATGGGTPDFEALQGYRRAAPLGIDADFGNTFGGGLGIGVVLADVETGWTDDHEDIAHRALDAFVGLTGAPYPWDHGTAVIGELVGADDGSGVRGIVPEAAVRLSTHQGNSANIPTAVVHAIDAVGPGDFVILEVQCFGGPPAPFPCEYVESIFVAVELATANGIHVVAAAGNGNNDLDSPVYGGAFDRDVRDSGAILVGASNGAALDKASFSNHGSRLDAHGWGFDVATCGYGDLFGAGSPAWIREYTESFSGTSSATPIVTGAAVVLDGIHRAAHESGLDPLLLRATLTATGTPQGAGGWIGPRPDLRAAIAALELPRIEPADPVAPGERYEVVLGGPPMTPCVVYSALERTSLPQHVPAYGWLWLAPPVEIVGLVRTDAGGTALFSGKVPAGTPSGTFAHLQALVFLPSGRARAAYSNYAEVRVE